MGFKVGDKVRVRKDLKQGIYGNMNYISCMDEFKDKIATIKEILEFNNCYMLDIDRNAYYWSGEMLEPIESSEKVAKSSEKVAKNIIKYNNKKYEVIAHSKGNVSMKIGERRKYGDKLLILKEYKEPILDDTEKKYIGNLIRPFRDEIKSIQKKKYKNKECIRFETNRDDKEFFELLSFPNNSMYKAMKLNEPYSLEKLGL